MKSWCVACLYLVLGTALQVNGQSDINFDFRKNIRHTGDLPEGFLSETGIRIPFSFSHSQSRLGIDNGNYIDIAAKFKTLLHFKDGLQDWSSSLFIGESYSMTPTIENRLVKLQDLLRLETRYLYNFREWLGVYAHGRMETSLLKSTDLDSYEREFELRDSDDVFKTKISAKELPIADAFRPIFFQENLGLVTGISFDSFLSLEGRGALSFRQTIADNQRVFVEEINDVRIVRDLQSFFQIGPVLGMSIGGMLFDEKVEYNAGADLMWPFWERPVAKDRSFLREINMEANAGLEIALSTWSYVGYEYTVVHIPNILHKFQQHHILTIDISFDWVYSFGQGTPAT
jgi:hypothetical protein